MDTNSKPYFYLSDLLAITIITATAINDSIIAIIYPSDKYIPINASIVIPNQRNNGRSSRYYNKIKPRSVADFFSLLIFLYLSSLNP